MIQFMTDDDSNSQEPKEAQEIDYVRGTTKTIEYTGDRPPTAVDEWDEVSAADAVHQIIPADLPAVEIVAAYKYHGGGEYIRFKLGESGVPDAIDPRRTFVLDTRRDTAPDLGAIEDEIQSVTDEEPDLPPEGGA